MIKRTAMLISILLLLAMCFCGCSQERTNRYEKAEAEPEFETENTVSYSNGVTHCEDCNKPLPKNDPLTKVFEGKEYCQECFDDKAYPIVLKENNKYCMSIVGYDDETGMFAVNIENKTQFEISVYDSDGTTSVDGNKKCIGETEGTHSFAYVDVPANEDITVFSSFRVDEDENWHTVYKMSDNHTFEFVMVVAQLENSDKFWDDTFKVELTPEMFGY